MSNAWPQVRFDDALVDVSRLAPRRLTSSDYLSTGSIPIVDQGAKLIAGYWNQPADAVKVSAPLIVFGDHSKTLKLVDYDFCVGAEGLKLLQPKESFDANFVFQFLRTISLPDVGYSRHYKFLQRINVPKPPLDEQRRIAAILDQADDLRRKRRLALEKLNALPQALFRKMFGDPNANPRHYPTAPLKSVGRITTGRTPPSGVAGLFGGDTPFVTPGDLGIDAPARRSVSEAGASVTGTVRGGSTLVCCIGATIGKMDIAPTRCAFNQQINAIEWSQEVDDLFGYFTLTFYKSVIALGGASTTLPILKKSRFEAIEIPVPHLTEQRAFADHAIRARKLLRLHRAQKDKFDLLFRSLQHQVFEGLS